MAAPKPKPNPPVSPSSAYERDFYGWAIEQAGALRAGRLHALDLDHLAEEIEDLGKEQFRKLESALCALLIHMLKWDQQPERRTRSWALSIEAQREEFADILADNPGLRPRREEVLQRAYPKARLKATDETGLPRSAFSVTCPYSLDDVLTRPFEWPDA